jgi:hypothetical protein
MPNYHPFSIQLNPTTAIVTCASNALTLAPYSFTDSYQFFTVPSFVTCMRVHLWGAGGAILQDGTLGGAGAFVTGLLSVTPGEQLRLIVGRAGGPPGAGTDWEGGGGQGGGGEHDGLASGGGRSAIQRWSASTSSWLELVTAGGGGGAGGFGQPGGAACWSGTSWKGANSIRSTVITPNTDGNGAGGSQFGYPRMIACLTFHVQWMSVICESC